MRIRRVSEFPLITLAGFRQMARKVGLNYRGHRSSGLVGWFAEHRNFRHRLPPKAAQKDPGSGEQLRKAGTPEPSMLLPSLETTAFALRPQVSSVLN